MNFTKDNMISLFKTRIKLALHDVGFRGDDLLNISSDVIHLLMSSDPSDLLNLEPKLRRLYQSVKYYYDSIISGEYDDVLFEEFDLYLLRMWYEIRSDYDTELYCYRLLRENPVKFYNIEHLKDFVMEDSSIYDHNYIRDEINKLSYSDFLKTEYWKGIRHYKLYNANYKCALCNSKEKLNVHHKTYEHHGLEHIKKYADEDLIVLCNDCHEKFHDKLYDTTISKAEQSAFLLKEW